ncbi:CIA30-domain-containing protein [Dissoconium aciculare CBS 342.82]|uniref:CIA30-domain-containing protein n=1 Tax=Dissoconium aciculare CBS 342.82 TaxID=1314786 RepID=A0A6J3MCN5_9PEZI|nr:CIA30-domain-containing protein [Dissoconium aciculare CBS 342.82]KAF1825786.1 CIA30-domain-containing protein [Dissoconium aciculare CBS 342.82]
MAKRSAALPLFGGEKKWEAGDWTASDDRVRGGKSQSYLEISGGIGRFYGNLDIQTLGGAGFASQRTTGEDCSWDLSKYAGIQIAVAKGDKKRYTLTLKDELLPTNETNGREQASISYECDFELPPQTIPGDATDRVVFIPWSSLNATYRGRLQPDAKPIDLEHVKRFSLMMRSFFGTQEGDFSLSIRSISALAEVPDQTYAVAARDSNGLEKGLPAATARAQPWDKLPVVLVASLCLFAVYYFTGRHSCRLGPSNVV